MSGRDPAVRHIPATFTQLAAKLAGAPVNTHSVVSLFSGCGGMDLGFRGGFRFGGKYYDQLPFDVVWANDISEHACQTYRRNLKHDIHAGDIAAVFDTLPRRADVVIGGFPCQDVSINGNRNGAGGERTILYRRMVEVIERVRPKLFVAENVKGLMQSHGKAFFDEMLADFRATGYTVTPKLYLAADYDVPQMRERIFIVGVRSMRRTFTHPDPSATLYMTAAQALDDLAELPEDQGTAHVWSKAARSPEQGDRRLKADQPSTTIRAEHHGNVQWHYALNRRLSLREAARLQSFPDEFEFPCGMRETERQIGNAVPPVLAWHIAKSVRECLES